MTVTAVIFCAMAWNTIQHNPHHSRTSPFQLFHDCPSAIHLRVTWMNDQNHPIHLGCQYLHIGNEGRRTIQNQDIRSLFSLFKDMVHAGRTEEFCWVWWQAASCNYRN